MDEATRAALRVIESLRSVPGTGINSNMCVVMRNDDGFASRSQLGAGTADSTTFLRGDKVWAVPGAGGGAAESFVTKSKWQDF